MTKTMMSVWLRSGRVVTGEVIDASSQAITLRLADGKVRRISQAAWKSWESWEITS